MYIHVSHTSGKTDLIFVIAQRTRLTFCNLLARVQRKEPTIKMRSVLRITPKNENQAKHFEKKSANVTST